MKNHRPTPVISAYGSVAELKRKLFTTEREDFAGRGTRSFAGRPLRWKDRWRVHACEAVEVSPETFAVWTLCGKNLPRSARDYLGEREVTCPLCRGALGAGSAA